MHTQYIEDTISEDLGGGFSLAERLVGSDLHRSRLAQAAVDANLVAAAVNHLLLDLWSYKNPTQTIPRCSMYGIFTYMWVIFRVNVGKYSIHGASQKDNITNM